LLKKLLPLFSATTIPKQSGTQTLSGCVLATSGVRAAAALEFRNVASFASFAGQFVAGIIPPRSLCVSFTFFFSSFSYSILLL
jgi:hypothetical protein